MRSTDVLARSWHEAFLASRPNDERVVSFMKIRIEERDDLGTYEVELEQAVLPDPARPAYLAMGAGPKDSGWMFKRQGTDEALWFVSDQSGLVYDVANEVGGRALDPVPSVQQPSPTAS